jgi:hypothetical protein
MIRPRGYGPLYGTVQNKLSTRRMMAERLAPAPSIGAAAFVPNVETL